MYTFEVFVNDKMKVSIQADYYKERFNRDIIFYERRPRKWWQCSRDLKIGMCEFPMIGHVVVKRSGL